jgi:hypothetical protein
LADQKISELTALTGANVADDDAIAIVDTSATETKKIVFSELKNALDTSTGFVRITGDTMTGALDVQSTITSDGLTSSAVITAQEGRSNTAGTGQIVIDPDDTTVSAAFRLDQADNKLNIDMTNAGTWQKKLSVYTGGDISFYEDTGTTAKFFWDASAESLGIGTSSPSVPLHVNTSGTSVARFVGGNDGNLYITNDSANVVTLQAASGDALSFNTNGGNERMRIDSSGNVGIGTDSPSANLHLSGQSQTIKLETTNDSSTFLNIRANSGTGGSFYVGQDSSAGSSFGRGAYAGVVWQSGAYPIVLATNNSERMRIDSSGNLLVGKTFSSSTEDGLELRSTNVAVFTRDGGNPLGLNRKTSDGDIIVFNKDGTTVGSIGTNGSTLYIGSGEGTDAYLGFGNQIIRPVTSTGASRDNAIDLGYTGMRFKDLYLSGGVKWTEGQVEINSGRLLQRSTGDASGLRFDGSGYTPFKNGSVADGTVDLGYSAGRYNNLYLSGGVYLGGVVGANKLEDYEEGTFTPALNASTGTITLNIAQGAYVKVGGLVHVILRIRINSISGASGTVTLTGLPFLIANKMGSTSYESWANVEWDGISTSAVSVPFVGIDGNSACDIFINTAATTNNIQNSLQVSDVAANASFRVYMTYQA